MSKASAKGNLRISGGRIITPMEERQTDLWVKDGKIIGLGDSPARTA